MESDSDRTIDSDELRDIIAETMLEKASCDKSSKKKGKVLRQKAKLHELSDSDSDQEVNKKTKPVSVKRTKYEPKQDYVVDTRPKCRYGNKCYRKNPDHIQNFSHTFDDEVTGNVQTEQSCNSKKMQGFKSTFDQCYGFYLTSVYGIAERFNNGFSLGIEDLLSTKHGTLLASAQFNYVFDIPWLMQQYPEEFRKCPLTIVHGEQRESKRNLEKSGSSYSNIKFFQAKLDIPFGTHHTKMMFLLYKEGLRVVIHTSNLVEGDWFQKTQGIWASPILPKLENGPSISEGESSTNFKCDLLEYITSYRIEEWEMNIKKHDFSAVKVVLIGSVPGRHVGSKKTAFGHLKMRKMLNLNGPSKDSVTSQWPLIGQFSSIGSKQQVKNNSYKL